MYVEPLNVLFISVTNNSNNSYGWANFYQPASTAASYEPGSETLDQFPSGQWR